MKFFFMFMLIALYQYVLKYFGRMKRNSAVLIVFAEVLKVTNDTGLFDSDLAEKCVND